MKFQAQPRGPGEPGRLRNRGILGSRMRWGEPFRLRRTEDEGMIPCTLGPRLIYQTTELHSGVIGYRHG